MLTQSGTNVVYTNLVAQVGLSVHQNHSCSHPTDKQLLGPAAWAPASWHLHLSCAASGALDAPHSMHPPGPATMGGQPCKLVELQPGSGSSSAASLLASSRVAADLVAAASAGRAASLEYDPSATEGAAMVAAGAAGERALKDGATAESALAAAAAAGGGDLQQGAQLPRKVPGANKFRLFLDRLLPTLTRRPAADGRWYTWEEFAIYYKEHSLPMWAAAWQREVRMAIRPRLVSIRWRTFAPRMACWSLRRFLRCIRWRSFACRMASWRAAIRGAVLKQMVDQRIDGGPCRR